MTTVLAWVGFGALVALPVLALRLLGASWKWFALGIASWMLGVTVKSLLQAGVEATPVAHLPWTAQAVIAGIISGAMEMGAAAAVLWRAKLRLPDLLAFGVAVGVFEASFALLLRWLVGMDAPVETAAGRFAAVIGGVFLLERLLALAGHTASRVLVYAGIRSRQWLPAAVAVVLFGVIDGTATYGALAKWNWDSAALLTRFYSFVAAIVALETAAAWWFVRRGNEPVPAENPG